MHNPTILHWHPLLPISSPQPSRLLSNHTPFYSSTFLRFCKFTENNKLPINRPIKAYHQPIHCHQPFSPNALHSSIPPLPHSNFDAFHNPTILHWHPLLPISSPQPSRLLSNHTPAFTVPRFYDFANSQKTSKLPINRPIKAYHQPITNLPPAYSLPSTLFSQRPPFPHSPIPILTHCTIQPSSIGTLFSPYPPHNPHGS